MKLLVIVSVLSFGGCSAAKSAIGSVLGPKPAPTVVNTVTASPTVIVREQPRGSSTMEKVGIVTTSAVVGAGVGAIVSGALDHSMLGGAAIGAGAGAIAGVAIAR